MRYRSTAVEQFLIPYQFRWNVGQFLQLVVQRDGGLKREIKAQLIAQRLIDSAWTAPAFYNLLNDCRTPKAESVVPLVQRLIAKFPVPVSRSQLVQYLSGTEAKELKNFSAKRLEPTISPHELGSSRMRSGIHWAQDWPIPPLDSEAELAAMLKITMRQLDWLAMDFPDHYLVRGVRKRSSGIRIMEAPKTFLKSAQRKILWDILNWIPAHPAAHGFITGRSVMSFVQPHINRPVVLRMDLEDFFPSIDANRVWGLFRSLGYPYEVIRVLTDLCTCYSKPSQLLQASTGCVSRVEQQRIISVYHRKHLPQGAPTSPALANLLAYRLDCRLAGLAEAAGFTYTRYADDLLFSGGRGLDRSNKSFSALVGAIVLEEGFRLQYRKTRVMRQSTCQSAAGIVINQRTNLSRVDFDILKATLYNCIRDGWESQNRNHHPDFRGHLLGRIHWVGQLNPQRAEKLRRLFEQIDW